MFYFSYKAKLKPKKHLLHESTIGVTVFNVFFKYQFFWCQFQYTYYWRVVTQQTSEDYMSACLCRNDQVFITSMKKYPTSTKFTVDLYLRNFLNAYNYSTFVFSTNCFQNVRVEPSQQLEICKKVSSLEEAF